MSEQPNYTERHRCVVLRPGEGGIATLPLADKKEYHIVRDESWHAMQRYLTERYGPEGEPESVYRD